MTKIDIAARHMTRLDKKTHTLVPFSRFLLSSGESYCQKRPKTCPTKTGPGAAYDHGWSFSGKDGGAKWPVDWMFWYAKVHPSADCVVATWPFSAGQ